MKDLRKVKSERREQAEMRERLTVIMKIAGRVLLAIGFIMILGLAGSMDAEQYGIITKFNMVPAVIKTLAVMISGAVLNELPDVFWS